MRKVISLGLLALMFSLLSGQVFAGNIEECNYLKDKNHDDYAPGLYGLCVAWHNADEDAAVALAEKFLDRAGFKVPGSEVVPDTKNEPDFYCPCWTEISFSDVCSLGVPTLAMPAGSSFFVVYSDETPDEFFSSDSANCIYSGQFNVGEEVLTDLGEPGLDCRAEVEAIASLLVDGGCD